MNCETCFKNCQSEAFDLYREHLYALPEKVPEDLLNIIAEYAFNVNGHDVYYTERKYNCDQNGWCKASSLAHIKCCTCCFQKAFQ